jgi:sarcosine oxidase subunit alpha
MERGASSMIDVFIVGAGPAGLLAAVSCAEHGLQVRIVDEFMKPGGRLLGQLHEEPNGQWWNGIEEAKRYYEQAMKLGVQIECGVSVYHAERLAEGWQVYTTEGIIEARVLLLATGAAETSVPIPGWTLPGVMSIGAAQVMTNVHRVQVGKNGIVIGINMLSMAITREIQLAGIQVKHVVLPVLNPLTQDAASPEKVFQSMLRASHLAPSPLIKFGSILMKCSSSLQKLGIRFYPKNGVKIWGIPIQLRTAALEIYGKHEVQGVRMVDVEPDGTIIPGSEREVAADFVCIAGGLYPLVELAAVAGCPFRYIPELGGHVPLHNERMQTPLSGLYVAGNITGIESAKVALAQGTVAGLSIAEELGRLSGEKEDRLLQAIDHLNRIRLQATIQFHPHIQQGRNTMARMWHEQSHGSPLSLDRF